MRLQEIAIAEASQRLHLHVVKRRLAPSDDEIDGFIVHFGGVNVETSPSELHFREIFAILA